ncbi:hypothetical protein SDC9_179420 [bioreactor metagenome]|uniref:Uncharacterized protein n=1 Tax=bioreactor metagenome TaxID=1076179 RepID=A0A645GYP7_9ZZZZ
MNGTDAGCRENREGSLGDHRHVDQDAVALLDAEALVNGCHALDFALQFSEGIDLLLVRFSRDVDQGAVVRTLGSVAVDRVVAKVGLATNEPLGKRRAGIIAHLGERFFPVDELGLFGPELVRLFDGILVKLLVRRHKVPLKKFSCTAKYRTD